MKRRAFNNKRDANEVGIVTVLEAMGCIVQRLDKPFDLLVNRKGQLHLIEVKIPKGKMNAVQLRDAEKWPVTTIRTVAEAQDFARGGA